MRFNKPVAIPTRPVLIQRILDTCFGTLGEGRKSYSYFDLCDKAAEQFEIDSKMMDDSSYHGNGLLLEVAQIIADYASDLNRKKAEKYLNRIFADLNTYERFLTTFCVGYSGSIDKWLGLDGSIDKHYEAAVFFSFMMLVLPERQAAVTEYLRWALAQFGIEDIEDNVWHEMTNYGGKHSERAVKTLAVINYTLLHALCKDNNKAELPTEHLQPFIETLYQEEIAAYAALQRAIEAWIEDIQTFEPRSINLMSKSGVRPQDFYIYPEFENSRGTVMGPTHRLTDVHTSQRMIVRAKTGMGKTMYLRMVSLCIMKKFAKKSMVNNTLLELARTMNVPEDMYVIFVPASMFSFCFNDIRYAEWTIDLVDLFFNCMFKLSASYNFYSGTNLERYSVAPLSKEKQAIEFTPELKSSVKNYVQFLARQGKLLLLVDSFDEIVSGDMRNAYIKALSSFTSNYCQYPEQGEVGAHVLLTTREMSFETMGIIESVLKIQHDHDVYGIKALTKTQSKVLIINWGQFYSKSPKQIDELIASMEQNHFFAEFAINPYMLSVICANTGSDYDRITHVLVNTLIDKTQRNYREKDEIVRDILFGQGIRTILQGIALKTIVDNNPHFSTDTLSKHIRQQITDDELTNEQIDRSIRKLHELFVTAVGLIVPADGEDFAYQFINDQVRYYLAAQGIRRELREYEGRSVIYQNILKAQDNVEGYVGLLIPLLADLGSIADPALSEMLVTDLALRDYDEREEPELLRAMLDILLGRYGANITTPSVIGNSDSGQATKRTQRLLLLRVLSSNAFNPTEIEKLLIRRSPAYLYNNQHLNARLLEILS